MSNRLIFSLILFCVSFSLFSMNNRKRKREDTSSLLIESKRIKKPPKKIPTLQHLAARALLKNKTMFNQVYPLLPPMLKDTVRYAYAENFYKKYKKFWFGLDIAGKNVFRALEYGNYLVLPKMKKLYDQAGLFFADKNKGLTSLTISGQLRVLPSWVFRLKNLVELDLSNNEIQSMPKGIAALKNLKVLLLHGNKIKDIPDISSMKKLRTLTLFSEEVEIGGSHTTYDKNPMPSKQLVEAKKKYQEILPNLDILLYCRDSRYGHYKQPTCAQRTESQLIFESDESQEL